MLSHFSRVRLFVTYGLWPTRLLCPWDSPGKNTGVGCHVFLQGIFPTKGSTQVSCISELKADYLPLSHWGVVIFSFFKCFCTWAFLRKLLTDNSFLFFACYRCTQIFRFAFNFFVIMCVFIGFHPFHLSYIIYYIVVYDIPIITLISVSVDILSLIPDMCLFYFFSLISIPKFLLILFAKF